MNRLTFLSVLFLLGSVTITAQSIRSNSCIYRTIEDFVENVCDNSESAYVDKVLAKKSPVNKYIINTDRKNKRLKEAFAVEIDGELYIQQYVITRYLAKGDRLNPAQNDLNFIKVQSYGEYDYLEWAESGGSGPGIGLGSGGFGSGIGLGTSINLGKKKVVGLIYDPVNFHFDAFKNCKDFNEFLTERHPEYAYECKKKKLDIEVVRKIMKDINKGYKSTVAATSENIKYVTVYPHRSIVRNSCTLSIVDEEVKFTDVSILDVTIDCEIENEICIKGTDACLSVNCDDDIEYIIVSKDKEKKTYMIEKSNEKDFEYYSGLVERRLERRKK